MEWFLIRVEIESFVTIKILKSLQNYLNHMGIELNKSNPIS